MKNRTTVLVMMVLGLFLFLPANGWPQSERDVDRTLSPYFFVRGDDPELDQLPLKSTSVKVNVSGVIADVLVTQVHRNEGKKPLEAVYIFPASIRAAVYGMKMTIGERVIVAKIREREIARQQYEEAKQAGKSASLLEQHRPNVFQMNVANILPSDVITVELRYTELLVPTDRVYEFVYPTVVGPRYSNQPAREANPWEKWIENPYLHEGELPTSTFDMTVNLAAGLPIQEITCPSHKVNINYDGPAVAAITLDGSDQYGGNRDFLLKYRLAGGKIETGLLLFEGDEENFFLLMVQPPERVSDVQIPAREYIFIVDVSGSMRGFPLKISKKLLRDLIGRLRPTDRFNVLLFAGGSSVMSSQSVSATPENIRHAIDLIERQRGGGGTELLPALKRALSLPKHEGFSRTVVIATDGYVTVEEEAFDLIRNNLGSANMFPFGIGSSVNRHLIEGMARVGMGEPFVITKPDEASQKANTFRKLIESPVLTGIKLDFGEFQTHHVEPPSIPDVLADRPVIVFGKWQGKAEGCIHMSGITGDRSFAGKIDVAGIEPLETNSALRYLWARHRIALLADYNRLNPHDERIQEVTTLGLSYNLLTAYTSFVAIDSQLRLRDGQTVTVKQPLPLPEGVSDYAVGNGGLVQKTLASPASAPSVRGEKVIMEEEPCEVKADHRVDRVSQEESNAKESYIELREITATGGLPKESVRRLIEKHMASLNGCCKLASGEQSGPKGEIVLTLTIDQKGRVIKVHPDRNHPINRRLGECIVGELKKVLFPAPEGGKTAVVTLVFVIE